MKKLKSIFYGSHVTIVLGTVSVLQSNSETGEHIQGNVMVNGIFLDCDEHFVYLGMNEMEITDALKISDIARITTLTEEEHEVLEDADIPEKEEEWN